MNSLVPSAIYAIVGIVAITQAQPFVKHIEMWGQSVMVERDKNADSTLATLGVECHDVRPDAEVSHPLTALADDALASSAESLPPVSAEDIASAPPDTRNLSDAPTPTPTPTGNGQMILINYLNSQKPAVRPASNPAPANTSTTTILYQNPNS